MAKGTIVYIGGFELPDKNAAAHRVLNNGKILRKLGYDVIFIGVNKNFTDDNLDNYKNIQGFKCWSIPYPQSIKEWINHLKDISKIKKIISLIDNVRAVICYNYQSVAFLKLKKFCKQNSIKILADCTEWYGTKGHSMFYRIIKGMDTFVRMRVIQKKLDGIIVISSYLEKYYRKATKKVLLIPPLVDKEEKKWNNFNELKYTNENIKFLYAGSPGKNKDKIDLIIDAFGKLDNQDKYILYISGITKEEYLELGFEERALLKVEKNIKFLGRISHQESIEYLNSVDYSIFLREVNRLSMAGFPTKFVEAVSAKTKVITNNSSDLKNYLIENVNGHFVNINDDSLVKLLNNIMAEKLNYKVTKNFDPNIFDYKNYIRETKAFLEKVLN